MENKLYLNKKSKDLDIEDLLFASLNVELKHKERANYFVELVYRMNKLRENKALRTGTNETDLCLYEILDMSINDIECKVHNERKTIYFHLMELAEIEIDLKKELCYN